MNTGCPFERLNQLKEKQYQVQQGVKRMNKKKNKLNKNEPNCPY